jgi:hypothetical protein
MEDGLLTRVGNAYKENFDPISVGLGLISTANNPDRAGNLGQALLMGRNARLEENIQRAAQAAAARKEKLSMVEKGLYETPEGIGRRSTVNTSQGAVFQQDVSPTGQVSMTPVYTPPAPQKEPSADWRQYTDPVSGQQGLYNQLTGEFRSIGTADMKPGGKPGPLPPAEQAAQKQSNLKRYATDLEDFASYFPVYDKATGARVSPEELTKRGFDRKTMAVKESGTGLATGALSALPSIASSSQDIDALRMKIGSNEFIDNLLNAKAGGATFGSLTEGEAKKLENFRSAIANPKAPPERIVSEYVALNRYIENELAPKYGGQQPVQQNQTSTGVTWRVK